MLGVTCYQSHEEWMIRVYVEGLGPGGEVSTSWAGWDNHTQWPLESKAKLICRQVFSIGIGEGMPAMAQLQHDVAGHAVFTEKR